MPSHYMEPRRRSEPVNVGRVRPTSRVRVMDERDQLTRADQRFDRQLESRHIVRMRDTRREAEEAAAESAARAAAAAAAIEARRKYDYEAKQQLRRARDESRLIAGDDLELTAKFAQMDDDTFEYARMLGFDLD